MFTTLKKIKNAIFTDPFLLYLSALIFLVLPSIFTLFDSSCDYYTDYLYCENFPSIYSKLMNFLLVVACITLLSIGYYLIIKNKIIINFKEILFVLILFMLINPFGSTDVHYYRAIARDELNKNINPYKGGFTKSIERLKLDSEVNNPAMYSPGWLEINKLIYLMSPLNENISIFVYKSISLLILLLSFLLIRKNFNSYLASILILNPLFLFEFLSNIHLDIFVLFFNIIVIIFIKLEKYYYSAFAVILSFLFKMNALINIALIYCLLFISNKTKYWKTVELIKVIFSISLGILLTILLYKRYYFGIETFKGLQIQSDWSYNTLFERINFSPINPLIYLLHGQYRGLGFGLYNKILILISFFLIAYSVFKNRHYLYLKNLNFRVIMFYLSFVNFIIPIFVLRTFFPWYLTWSAVFLIFCDIKYKAELLFLYCLIPAIYYSFVFLLGHFEEYLNNPIYSLMVFIEYLVMISASVIYIKTRFTKS